MNDSSHAHDGVTVLTALVVIKAAARRRLERHHFWRRTLSGLKAGEALMSNIYSTSDVASIVGASPVTMHSWKQRKSDRLIEGQHWLNQDGQLFWTAAGISALQAIKGASPTDASTSDAASSVGREGDTPSGAEVPILQHYESLINALSRAIALPKRKPLPNKHLGEKPCPLNC